MRTDRRAQFVLIAAFALTIAAPGLIQLVSELQNGEPPRVLDVFRQPPTARNLHAYEQSLDDSSVVINLLRPPMQYFQWRFLGDAGEKAVVGRHGWLFYRPSVRYVTERKTTTSAREANDPLLAIRSFRDQLRGRRIRLLVVVVPNKESVYPEMLAQRANGVGTVMSAQTRRLLDGLDRHGIEHVNLFEIFRRARPVDNSGGSAQLYLAQDTHWSPDGARLAAAAVARGVLEQDIDRGDRAYIERPVTVRRHGDLVQMLQVPQIERSLDPEVLACSQVIESDTGTPYTDSAESPVLILGDSFLRIYEQDEPFAAGFVAHLARELRQPLTSLINDGGASTLVRQQLSRRPELLINKRLVIWEFAEREIRFGAEGWQIVPLIRQPRGKASESSATSGPAPGAPSQ